MRPRYGFRISIPWVPPALNRALRSHWARRAEDFQVAAGHILGAVGKNHGETPPKVRVTIEMHRKRPMDRDGAQGACKPIFDALVRLGWAQDDSEAHMEQNVLPVVVDRRRSAPVSTVIVLQDHREPGMIYSSLGVPGAAP